MKCVLIESKDESGQTTWFRASSPAQKMAYLRSVLDNETVLYARVYEQIEAYTRVVKMVQTPVDEE